MARSPQLTNEDSGITPTNCKGDADPCTNVVGITKHQEAIDSPEQYRQLAGHPTGWLCPHSGCCRRFSRRSDLARHESSRHQKSRQHVCPVVGCFKKQHRTAFSRRDKLVDHLRAVHDHHTPCTCPLGECDRVQLSLDELFAHLRLKHPREFSVSAESYISGILAKVCAGWHHCPVMGCKSWLRTDQFPNHVLQHDARDIQLAQEALPTVHWTLVKGTCTHRCEAQGNPTCSCPFTKVQICCPVCSSNVDALAFREHMCSAHLIDKRHAAHFGAWQAHCDSEKEVMMHAPSERWSNENTERAVTCPVCSWSSNAHYLDHHFSMRQNLDHLKPHRLDILKLWPRPEYRTELCGFVDGVGWAPVWDDLAQPLRLFNCGVAGPSGAQQVIDLTMTEDTRDGQ